MGRRTEREMGWRTERNIGKKSIGVNGVKKVSKGEIVGREKEKKSPEQPAWDRGKLK
jgi:hypothetical protein